MKALLHATVRRWWAGQAGPAGAAGSVLTAPLEAAFRAAVHRRNARFDVRGGTPVEGLHVVSVGNLAVGGTGKTPLSAWAVRLLADAGVPTALLARGYGRDELLLHQRWNPDVPVVADADRVRGARVAREGGARAVVLDDGFQHRRLARDVDLVLIAAEDPFPGRMLPRGPFREPPSALDRAHGVVVTRREAPSAVAAGLADRIGAEHPHLEVGVAALLSSAWQDLSGAPAEPPAGACLCAAAIARPRAFRLHVEAATGARAELLEFADHHDYSEADARAIRARAGARTVAVTEKDAVKLQPFEALLGSVRVLVQALEWERGEERIANLVTIAAPEEA